MALTSLELERWRRAKATLTEEQAEHDREWRDRHSAEQNLKRRSQLEGQSFGLGVELSGRSPMRFARAWRSLSKSRC